MANKKLRLEFYGICQKCFSKIAISKEEIIKKEENQGTVPLKSHSASGILWCSECGSTDMTIHYSYKNVYRKRCNHCGEMFDAYENYEKTCLECTEVIDNAIVKLGA